MQHRWLAFLSIGFLTIVVFIFFWYRNQPIEIVIPEAAIEIGSITEPSVTFVNPSYGAETPNVSIVVFSDFECTACSSLADSLEVVSKTYPNDVRVIWKNLPNESVHPLSTPAAIAAHCADEQGMFWEYHDILFDRQTYLSESQFTTIAQELSLDTDTFNNCYQNRDTLPIVKKDFDEGIALGLTSTPTMFIEDEMVIGAISTQSLLDVVAQMITD